MRRHQPNLVRQSYRLVCAVAILFLPCVGVEVYGCQCREREPPCAQYSSADAIFVGLVSKISPRDDNLPKSVHFNIDRTFRGVSGSTAEIVEFGTSCDYGFTERKTYLVYAYRTSEGNKLYTHFCTRTTELSNANADLGYLNALSEKGQPMEIVGVLAEDDKRLKNINIVVRNSDREYRTVSDKDGWFRLIVPKPGSYRVSMFLPLYVGIIGTKAELDQIKNRVFTKRRMVLEYEVLVNPGKCSFINPPLFIDYLEYRKHRGTNPQTLRNKRPQRTRR